MKILEGISLDYDDVLIRPQRSTLKSRSEVNLKRAFYFYHSPRTWTGIPIFCSNMSSIAGKNMALSLSSHKICTALHKYHSVEELIDIFLGGEVESNDREILRKRYDYIWISIGKSIDDVIKLKEFVNKTGHQPNICIDVPNGQMDCFVDFCRLVRETFPESIIMAGNVAVTESTQELIIHGGVDIVKLQIGPGKMCETRKVTGVGVGTISCIDECSSSAHGLKSDERRLGLVCSDGGCKNSGDVCKSFVANSDFSMLGNIFAGTEECCGEWEYETTHYISSSNGLKMPEPLEEGQILGYNLYDPDKPIHYSKTAIGTEPIKQKTNLLHYGMSSHHAQIKHAYGVKPYRASEGKVSKIPYKGPVNDTVQELLGGLRSCGAYIGARSLKDFSKCGQFVRVNRIHQDT
jgi:GMP reductase